MERDEHHIRAAMDRIYLALRDEDVPLSSKERERLESELRDLRRELKVLIYESGEHPDADRREELEYDVEASD